MILAKSLNYMYTPHLIQNKATLPRWKTVNSRISILVLMHGKAMNYTCIYMYMKWGSSPWQSSNIQGHIQCLSNGSTCHNRRNHSRDCNVNTEHKQKLEHVHVAGGPSKTVQPLFADPPKPTNYVAKRHNYAINN